VIERRSSPGRDRLGHGGFDVHRGAAVGEVQQQHKPSGPLDDGAHGAAAALAQDEVAFPVAGHGAISDLGGPFGDHDHVRDPAPAIDDAALLAAGSP